MCGLLSGQPPLQNPTPGVPVAEGGNVFRRLTGAMVHPSQVEALCWRLHGMGGDSSTCVIRVRCWFHLFYMWWYAGCEPSIQCTPYTVCTVHTGCIPYAVCEPFHSCALYAACAVAFACTPYDDGSQLHSCVLYPVCAVYAAHVPHAAHASHLACVPYAACSMYALLTPYGACAPYTFFQLFQMIWHFKSDFSLLLFLVMSLFPYTQYCAFMLLRTNTWNCFQNDTFTKKN